jgi:hypothetical protein
MHELAIPCVISSDDKGQFFFAAFPGATSKPWRASSAARLVDAEMLVDAALMRVQGLLADAEPRPLGG